MKERFFLVFSIAISLLVHLSALFILQGIPLIYDKEAIKRSAFFPIDEENLSEHREEIVREFQNLILSPASPEETSVKISEMPVLPSFSLNACENIAENPLWDISKPGISLSGKDMFQGLLSSAEEIANEGLLIGDREPLSLVALSEGQPEFSIPQAQSLDCDRNLFGTLVGSDHFNIVVELTPKGLRPGYVFKATLIPKSGVVFKRMHQNYFFLVDRSNSIPRKRYYQSRKAVYSALSLLKPEDTFNILLFDDRVARLSPQNLACNEENKIRAHDFLEKQGHGGIFASTDIYSSLGKIIPQDVSDLEVNTAILLSDGDTYLSLEKQRQTIGGWTLQNRGKVSLFCIASGEGNNLPLLDLLANFNKGTLIYAPQYGDIEERLLQLIRVIQNPVGKQIVATSISTDKQMQISLFPRKNRLPDLYQEKPYVLYGSTNRLSEFMLFLQGKYYDQPFDIKKKVSFNEAQSGTLSLERQWFQLLAHDYYEQFFKDGKLTHLETAKQMLTPLNIPVPFLPKNPP